MKKSDILHVLSSLPGNVGFYYKDLVSGETLCLNENGEFLAASVIKLPVYAVIMKLVHEGKVSLDEELVCNAGDKVPSCGVLRFFPDGTKAPLRTLCAMMITISDNTATNMLISRFGIPFLSEQFREIGFEKTHIERLLFDGASSAKGMENYIVPCEFGDFLEKVYRHTFISEETSAAIEDLLLEQQVNHKIPGYLPHDIDVAHKTGEDTNLTNDVGIVYAKSPFVIAFASNHTDVPAAERAIREISLALACPEE